MARPPTLLDVERTRRWTGSRALVPLDPATCPTCGGLLLVVSYGQPALFRHGGYGATLVSTERWCPGCGWRLECERQERRPW